MAADEGMFPCQIDEFSTQLGEGQVIWDVGSVDSREGRD